MSIVSTTPGFLADLAALLPTSPAMTAFLGAITSGAVGTPLVALAVWAVLAFVVTLVATTMRRTTSPAAALA